MRSERVRRPEWVRRQLVDRGIRDVRVLDAMARVPRELFVREEARMAAYADEALSIGHGQTISQPYMVARICEELALRSDERVLDVGGGSGYQAAVLAELAREVHSIERIPELAERARLALAEAGATNVTVHVGDGSLGLPEHAPYGGIAVAAAAPEVPAPLLAQLAPSGRLVVPVGTERNQQLLVVAQTADGPAVVHSVPCRFVPLVGAEGFTLSPGSGQDTTRAR
jgi:protein-L-isoaspartate(D-aspartate) O-methyltransferase